MDDGEEGDLLMLQSRVLSGVMLASLGLLVVVACGDSVESIPNIDTTGGDAGASSSSSSSSGSSSGSSGAANPCATNNGGCDVNAVCEGTSGTAVCKCKPGWTGDGRTCADIDECATDNGGCGANATCTNTQGSRTCTCETGYADGGAGCSDIDECAAANGGCDMNALCTNTVGGRTCACKAGFDGNGQACAIVTTTIDADTNFSTDNLGARNCADGGEMVAYNVTALTATTATLDAEPSAGCLSPNDEVLVLNLQGTAAASGNVGNYELLTVKSVAGAVVTFDKAKTKFFGEAADDDTNIGTAVTNQRVVLQRVPGFGNLVVDAGVTVTANAWDGLKGGVFALSAAGTVTVNGTVTMDGKGYRGAPQTTTVNTTGAQGESIDGLGAAATQTSSAGRGGGGRGDNTACRDHGSSAGGGGHGTAGQEGQDPLCAGKGGGVYGDDELTKLTMGSGGGAGGSDNTFIDNPRGGFGGAGGGIVFVRATGAVGGTGSFQANGLAGQGETLGQPCAVSNSTLVCWDYSGTGGGGAGGAIAIAGASFADATTSVAGGAARSGHILYARDSGAGGAGRVKTP